MDRFVNHFCALIYSDGRLVGFPSHLGLIRITCEEGDEVRVGLTEAGLEYVRLHNPVLDGQDPYSSSMSEEESAFMIRRIKEHLPATWGLMCFIMATIEGGGDTPTELSEAIASAYGSGTTQDWNSAQVGTYRTGALGLLGDMGLIERGRDGRRVTYFLTQAGEKEIKGD